MPLSKPCASGVSHLSFLAPPACSAWKRIPLFAPFINQNKMLSYHLYGDISRDTTVPTSLYSSLNILHIPQFPLRTTVYASKSPTLTTSIKFGNATGDRHIFIYPLLFDKHSQGTPKVFVEMNVITAIKTVAITDLWT